MHRTFCQSLLVGLGCVFLSFFNRIPTEDRHELMRGRGVVCCNGRARLAQSMRRAAVKCSLVAPVLVSVGHPRKYLMRFKGMFGYGGVLPSTANCRTVVEESAHAFHN
jgi:hypothetical protein